MIEDEFDTYAGWNSRGRWIQKGQRGQVMDGEIVFHRRQTRRPPLKISAGARRAYSKNDYANERCDCDMTDMVDAMGGGPWGF